MIDRVVSGGQTGVDVAALRAARGLGIATGGWAPRFWMTLDGPALWLADYGLIEHAQPGYPPRTEANVRYSDATLRLAADFESPGERCTLRMIDRYKKPRADVFLMTDRIHGGYRATGVVVDGAHCSADERSFEALIAWVRRYRVINVAGNSEQTAPGIGAAAEALLRSLFMECNGLPLPRAISECKHEASDYLSDPLPGHLHPRPGRDVMAKCCFCSVLFMAVKCADGVYRDYRDVDYGGRRP